MAQEIYQWARNLAVYYIILTALMHIMPDPRYSRYVRSFMGILLILIVTSPLLNLLHLEEQMDGLFHKKILEEEFAQPFWGQVQGEEIVRDHYLQAYEQEVAEQIRGSLEEILEGSCEVLEVQVHMEMGVDGEGLQAAQIRIWLSGAENSQMRERVEHELAGAYKVTGEKVELFFEEMG